MCNILFYILMTIMVIVFISMGIFTRMREKKDFNGGICPRCGSRLKNFDMASDGSRGYDCPKCGYTTWCSYDVDKIN